MACSLHELSSLERDVSGPPMKPASRSHPGPRMSIFSKEVSTAALMTVEIPLLGVLLMVTGVSVLVAPDTTIRGIDLDLPFFYTCPLYLITGIPCLFCGLTRSFMAMGGLDIRQAFIFHPLGPALYTAMLAAVLLLAGSIASRRRLLFSFDRVFRSSLIRWGAAVVIAAWLAKVVIWHQTGLL